MKTIKRFICIAISVVVLFTGSVYIAEAKSMSNAKKELSSKLIRFHVIANSDSMEDQALKLKVRDNVLKYISPKLKNGKTIGESRKILKENDAAIKKISETTIKNSGYNYNVETKLGRENFPVKTYGNITLPEGEYEAYKIIIGSAEGKNWWCVMFPPLCFVDITKGEVAYKETQAQMKNVLTDKEYNLIDNTKENNVKVKFKFFEVFKNLLGK